MTASHWRTVAIWCIGATAVLLVLSLQAKSRAEHDAGVAVAELTKAKAALREAQTLANAGITASDDYRHTIDSLWTVINARRAALLVPKRQRTPVVVTDVTDTLAVVQTIAVLSAENDTLRADLSEARVALEQERAAVDALVVSAQVHAAADSVRFAAIGAAVSSANDNVLSATNAMRPRWWKRLGRGVVATTKAAGLVAVGIVVGRRL